MHLLLILTFFSTSVCSFSFSATTSLGGGGGFFTSNSDGFFTSSVGATSVADSRESDDNLEIVDEGMSGALSVS